MIFVHRLAYGVVVLGTYHLATGGAILVQSVVLVAHTGIAVLSTAWSPVVRVFAVGIGHVNKRRVGIAVSLAGHFHLVALGIVLGGFGYGHLLAARNGTDARITESQCLRLYVALGLVAIPMVLLVAFLALVFYRYLILVGHAYMHIAYLLAYLYAVLQRHVAALQVAYQVVEAAGAGINVHTQALAHLAVVLYDGNTARNGHTITIHHGLLALHIRGSQLAVGVVHVAQQFSVQRKGWVEGQTEHIHIVKQWILKLQVQGLIGLQGHVLPVNLYRQVAVHISIRLLIIVIQW